MNRDYRYKEKIKYINTKSITKKEKEITKEMIKRKHINIGSHIKDTGLDEK